MDLGHSSALQGAHDTFASQTSCLSQGGLTFHYKWESGADRQGDSVRSYCTGLAEPYTATSHRRATQGETLVS